MKILLTFTLAATLTCALPAWATCSPEEATAKREQLAQEVSKLTQQNPAKAKEMNDERKRPVNTPCVVKRTPTCAEATA
ncbi:hypothetical protein LOY64_08295 [Pseudomonas corrugata]|uniref:hypothetical protein n=1 Tax=Pseudomonas corrugata TaxID=47879 RepID=UPI0022320AE8|nr:hypothetical protein [Pseudomonas corrugata]UZD96988.1 hypothetical protein LOY64_08295 [Pseudomonas corrugata]